MHEQTFVGQSSTLAQIQASFFKTTGFKRTEFKTTGFKGQNSKQAESKQASTTPVAAAAHAVAHTDVTITAPTSTHPHGNTQGQVYATLLTLLADELRLETHEIDADSQFVDLGLDSITGVTWIRKINETYHTDIEAIMVYSYPTLAQLTEHVVQQAAPEVTGQTTDVTTADVTGQTTNVAVADTESTAPTAPTVSHVTCNTCIRNRDTCNSEQPRSTSNPTR